MDEQIVDWMELKNEKETLLIKILKENGPWSGIKATIMTKSSGMSCTWSVVELIDYIQRHKLKITKTYDPFHRGVNNG